MGSFMEPQNLTQRRKGTKEDIEFNILRFFFVSLCTRTEGSTCLCEIYFELLFMLDV